MLRLQLQEEVVPVPGVMHAVKTLRTVGTLHSRPRCAGSIYSRSIVPGPGGFHCCHFIKYKFKLYQCNSTTCTLLKVCLVPLVLLFLLLLLLLLLHCCCCCCCCCGSLSGYYRVPKAFGEARKARGRFSSARASPFVEMWRLSKTCF